MMRLLNYIILCLMISGVSCSQSSTDNEKDTLSKDDKAFKGELLEHELILLDEKEQSRIKRFDDISFAFKPVSSIEYIRRSGRKVDPEDLSELQKESIFMIEFIQHKSGRNILDIAANDRSRDESVQYLVGEIESDFSIVQNGKSHVPLGVQYDGQVGNSGNIRVTFFMEGVNLNQPYKIQYNDQLFGNGMIQIKQNKAII